LERGEEQGETKEEKRRERRRRKMLKLRRVEIGSERRREKE